MSLEDDTVGVSTKINVGFKIAHAISAEAKISLYLPKWFASESYVSG